MPTLAEATIARLEPLLARRSRIKDWEYKLLHAAYLEAKTPKEKRKFPGKMIELDPPIKKDSLGQAFTVGSNVIFTGYNTSNLQIGCVERFTKKRVVIRTKPHGWKKDRYPADDHTWLVYRQQSQITKFTAPLDASKP